MSYPINYPTPQGANIQIFYAGGRGSTTTAQDWTKPQGASFVWFTLIGAGGPGNSIDATGGCGTVTNFMGPAFLIPDVLQVVVGAGGAATDGGDTSVLYRQKATTGYILLSATGGKINGATTNPVPSNYFSAMGFYQSTGGTSGNAGTFLSAGGDNGNYGYVTAADKSGYFQMQPIIVSTGGKGDSSTRGGIGSGGGFLNGVGGDGLAVIISW